MKPNRSQASVEQRRMSSREYRRNLGLEEKAKMQADWRKKNPDKRKAIKERFELKKLKKLESLAGRPKPINCELCGAESTGSYHGAKVKINWDHDHVTGLFRGWLCTQCNMALGLVKDSPERLRRMAKYIEDGGIGTGTNPSEAEVNLVVARLENL